MSNVKTEVSLSLFVPRPLGPARDRFCFRPSLRPSPVRTCRVVTFGEMNSPPARILAWSRRASAPTRASRSFRGPYLRRRRLLLERRQLSVAEQRFPPPPRVGPSEELFRALARSPLAPYFRPESRGRPTPGSPCRAKTSLDATMCALLNGSPRPASPPFMASISLARPSVPSL